jgi:hypothetical protein
MLTHKEIDGFTATGEPTRVRVNALPITKLEEFLTAQGDVPSVVKLTTGLDPETLSAETALDVADAADALNDPLAARLLQRAQALLQKYQAKPTLSPTSSRTSSPSVAPQPGTKPNA